MSHPNVDDLDRIVLMLSNQQDGKDRMFIEVPDGSPKDKIPTAVAVRRLDVGWFDQTWIAEEGPKPAANKRQAYTLRNIRSGTYLQAGAKNADGSSALEMTATRNIGPTGKAQLWLITDDGGFARIQNVKSQQVFELIEAKDGAPANVVLKDNDTSNKETQTWKYERISRSAQDIEKAMLVSPHMPDQPVEYQKMDACYISLPPKVRHKIWETTGLGSGPLVWRNQIFDCDDFAFAAKAAVSRWVAENLRGQGYTMLFGVTFGQRLGGPETERHAYNWYLDWQDLKDVVFFEPQNGLESDDGWGYKGYYGIF